jgi:hypothetical protein
MEPKKQNKTKGIANRPNRIVSDQMRRAQAQGHVFGWAKELTRALSERKKKNYMLELPEIILVFLSLLFEIVAGHFGCIFRYFGSWFRNGVSGINLQFVHL